MASISEAIKNSGISRKEAVLLVAHTLVQSKEWVIAHDDEEVSAGIAKKLVQVFSRRQAGEPIAYILGKKEFYGRDFIVTPDVLIPRPETETIIDEVKNLPGKKVLDVGCGSGCIGITLKLENPELDVMLSDISKKALTIAKQNAKNLAATVNFLHSDLLQNAPKNIIYDIIIANLPYVDENWEVSPSVEFEPKSALFASDGGLTIVKKLIAQASRHLTEKGHLVLELDPCQHKEITDFAGSFDFKKHSVNDYILIFQAKCDIIER